MAGYLTTLEELQERARLARSGTPPYDGAVDELLEWAEEAVDERPDPERRLRIRGTSGSFVDDTNRAYGLALAHGVSGRSEYAEAARETILAWVERTTELRNACADSGACQTSLIVARVVPGFVFAAQLLEEAGSWTEEDRRALEGWLDELILPVLPRLDNNWGDAGNFAETVIADYLGDEQRFRSALRRWERRLDLLGPDGDIPEETRRGDDGIRYTQEALVYKVAVAAIAERRGADLWTVTNGEGVGLKAAVDYLAHHWDHPEEWPWHDDPDLPPPGPAWELLYARWCDPAYLRIADGRRPYGDRGNSAVRWTTLTAAHPRDACAGDGG